MKNFRVGLLGISMAILGPGCGKEATPPADETLAPVEVVTWRAKPREIPQEDRAALFVPSSSLVSRGQTDHVFVAEDGVARIRTVSTGDSQDGETEILGGLDAGAEVVLSPPADLRDGQPLAVE